MKLRLKVLITVAVVFIISAHLLGCHNYDLEKNEPVVYYEPYEYKLGDIRLQFYSDTMFRLEQGKDGAFEDRTTFNISTRKAYEPVTPVVEETSDKVLLKINDYTVTIPKNSNDVNEVTVNRADEVIWQYSEENVDTHETYLPEPSKTPDVWAFADNPRLILPEKAYEVQENASDVNTNGWEYTENIKDYYIFVANQNAKQLRYDLNYITGPSEFIPIKALGLWYSRFTPYTSEQILDLIDEYRKNGYPLDFFVVDTDWRLGASTGYDVNTMLFPDMKKFVKAAHKKNVNLAINDHSREYAGSMLHPEQLTWHSTNLTKILDYGYDVWWYDRNWHFSLNSPFAEYHPHLLGQDMYTYFTDEHNGNNRTLTMSNAYWIISNKYSGKPSVSAHKYTLQWTGDTHQTAKSLREQLTIAVEAGVLSGTTYLSADIGGHLGGYTEANDDLFVRWTQFGALSNIMRYHSAFVDRTPWTISEQADEISKEYINMRYRLIPFFYEQSRLNYETGMPIMKRLDFEYPQYEESTDNTQYMLGDGIIVAPIVTTTEMIEIPTEMLSSTSGKGVFEAEYFKNKKLDGEPVYRERLKSLELNWGESSPKESSLGKNNFSGRFSGQITNTLSEPISLVALADDGVRIYVNGEKKLDCWKSGDSLAHHVENCVLEPGETYDIVIEYLELTGNASVSLKYSIAGGNAGISEREVFIPDGTWIDVWTGTEYTGPCTIKARHSAYTSPIFVKKGTLTPLANVGDYIDVNKWEKIVLDVYTGDDFTTELYEDDGKTESYKDGVYRKTPLSLKAEKDNKHVITIGKAKGNYVSEFKEREWTVRIHVYEGQEIESITVNGEKVKYKTIERSDDGDAFACSGASRDTDVVTVTFEEPLNVQSVVVVDLK